MSRRQGMFADYTPEVEANSNKLQIFLGILEVRNSFIAHLYHPFHQSIFYRRVQNDRAGDFLTIPYNVAGVAAGKRPDPYVFPVALHIKSNRGISPEKTTDGTRGKHLILRITKSI